MLKSGVLLKYTLYEVAIESGFQEKSIVEESEEASYLGKIPESCCDHAEKIIPNDV
jgi:hypothetical protein